MHLFWKLKWGLCSNWQLGISLSVNTLINLEEMELFRHIWKLAKRSRLPLICLHSATMRQSGRWREHFQGDKLSLICIGFPPVPWYWVEFMKVTFILYVLCVHIYTLCTFRRVLTLENEVGFSLLIACWPWKVRVWYWMWTARGVSLDWRGKLQSLCLFYILREINCSMRLTL